MREREIVFRAIPPERDADHDEIMSVVKDTNKIVKRIDARDVKRGKRQAEIDRQEKCYGYWEIGKRGKGAGGDRPRETRLSCAVSPRSSFPSDVRMQDTPPSLFQVPS